MAPAARDMNRARDRGAPFPGSRHPLRALGRPAPSRCLALLLALLVLVPGVPRAAPPATGGLSASALSSLLGSVPPFDPRAEGFPAAGSRLETIIDSLERAAAAAPEDADASARLAIAYGQRGTVEGRVLAVRRMERALELDPGNPDYVLALGYLRLQQGFEHYARESFEQAETLAPADVRAPLEVGESYFREWRELRQSQDCLQGAERAFGRAQELRPASAEAAVGLAVARRARGDRVGAEEALDRARSEGATGAWLDLVGGLLAYERDRDEEAEARFERGIAALSPEEREPFEDVTPLLPLGARADFRTLAPAERKAATRRLWREWDPSPTTEVNERRLEHWGRVVLADLYFAVPSLGIRGWDTDRGQALIRYGEPTARAWDPGVVGFGKFQGPFVYWKYEVNGTTFQLAFEDRGLHGNYTVPPETKPGGWAQNAAEVEGRLPQLSQWKYPGVDLPLPVAWYRLRGEGKALDVALAYQLPSEEIPWRPHGAYWELDGERRLVVYDVSGKTVSRRKDEVCYRARPSLEAARHARHTGALVVPVLPGEHGLALEVEEASRAVRLGWRKDLELAPLAADTAATGALAMSDLVFARKVEKAPAPVRPALPATPEDARAAGGPAAPELPEGAIRRGDFLVEPIATGVFQPGQRAFLYYEVYGLATHDESGTLTGSRYDVTYRMEALDQPVRDGFILKRLARRLLGVEKNRVVTWRFERSGTSATAREQLELDARSLPAGRYRVTVTVEDRRGGTEARREAEFSIGEDGS